MQWLKDILLHDAGAAADALRISARQALFNVADVLLFAPFACWASACSTSADPGRQNRVILITKVKCEENRPVDDEETRGVDASSFHKPLRDGDSAGPRLSENAQVGRLGRDCSALGVIRHFLPPRAACGGGAVLGFRPAT
jgi:hypothetical protein